MARSITTIQDEIITQVQTDIPSLTSSSQTAIWRLWTYIVATAIFIHESLWDIFKADLTTLVNNARVGTAQWLQAKALEFQYSTAEPQILQVVDFAPQYAVVDESLRIVKSSAVKQQSNRRVIVKVAKDDGSGGLTALNGTELSAFRSYIKAIQFAGTSVDVQSLEADRLLLDMEVFFDGQYVQTNVATNIKTALSNYLSALPFDGVVLRTTLIDIIQSVDGVVDVRLDVAQGRPQAVLVTSTDAIKFYDLANGINNRQYEATAGYLVLEDTTGYTFDDTVTFTIA